MRPAAIVRAPHGSAWPFQACRLDVPPMCPAILDSMRFAPEYVAYVLNENFEDAKTNFLAPLMALHYAHLVMLANQRIISHDDAHAIRLALDSVSQDDVRQVTYDG